MTPRRALAAALIVVAVAIIYAPAVASYFFNDDFHWLQSAALFEPANLLRLDRYDHFYRPVIEIYFYLGRTVFGCHALPFHITSVAIHLVNTLVLFLFARTLTQDLAFAGATALFFAVQPGFVEAVAWVGAITDLLPALWYLLTLWLHLLFLRTHRWWFYSGALVTFLCCLLTHESSATLLVMMMALEATLVWHERWNRKLLVRHAARYAPFAALLAGSLAIAYLVNSRSYLVREGYYAFGWHAIPNILNYIIGLYVGKRNVLTYAAIVLVVAAVLIRGTPRVRFFIVWILVTLLPVSFFTWGNASRYLYVPAAGFSLLLAAGAIKLHALLAKRLSPRAAMAAATVVALAVAVRFAVFAFKGTQDFRERSLPYERFAAALKTANPMAMRGSEVPVDAAAVYGIPEIYVDPAAQVAYCTTDVHVVFR